MSEGPAASGPAPTGRPRSIRANALATAAAQFAAKVLGFGVVMILTRLYTVEDYGRFALAATIAAFLLPALDLGTDLHLTRVAASDPASAPAWLGTALLLKTGSLLVALPLAIVIARAAGLSGETTALVAWALLAIGALALTGSFTAVLRARGRMDIEALLTVVSRVLILACTAVPALLGLGIVAVGASIAAGAALSVGLAFLLTAGRGVRAAYRGVASRWRSLVAGGLPFALTAVMVSIYFRIATVLLARFHGERSVGLYNANANLVAAAMLISQAIVTAVFPVVARAGSLADPALHPVLRRATTLSLALGLPLVIGTSAVAPALLHTLYGPGYAEGGWSLTVLVGTVPVLFLTNLLGHCLAAVGRQRLVLLVAGGNAVLNVALNLWLVPRFDYAGASLATLVTELAGLASFVIILWPNRNAFLEPNGLVAVFAANGVLAAGLFAIRGIGFLPTCAIGALLYLGLLFATRLLRPSDLPVRLALFGAKEHR